MNIFNNLKVYQTGWNVKDERPFSQAEKDAVINAETVASNYGISVQFTMKGGGLTFIPLSEESSLGVGEVVDLEKAALLTLEKSGANDIYRVKI